MDLFKLKFIILSWNEIFNFETVKRLHFVVYYMKLIFYQNTISIMTFTILQMQFQTSQPFLFHLSQIYMRHSFCYKYLLYLAMFNERPFPLVFLSVSLYDALITKDIMCFMLELLFWYYFMDELI